MTTQPPPIIWKGAHPSNYRARVPNVKPEAITLHIAAGPISAVDSWFNTFPHIVDGKDVGAACAHFCVAKSGEIHQYCDMATTAPAAQGIIEAGHTARLIDDNTGISPNDWSLSIEHEGQSGDMVTPAQLNASTRLSAWLWATVIEPAGARGLALDRNHFLRHADISPQSRPACPGWSEVFISDYIARVKLLLQPAPPPVDPRDVAIAEMRRWIFDDAAGAALRGQRLVDLLGAS